MASQLFDEFMRGARIALTMPEGAFFAQLATAEALGRIADVLEAAWEDYLKEEKDGGANTQATVPHSG